MTNAPRLLVDVMPAECHVVRNGYEHAQIFLRHGVVQEERGPRVWISLAITSSFGDFGYHWSHCGPGPWHDFLAKLDREYAMTKLMGADYKVVDFHTTAGDALEAIIEMRRQGDLNREEARESWNEIQSSMLHDETVGQLIERLSSTPAFQDDYYERVRHVPNPQAVGFWEKIWTPWIEQLAARMAA